jgi:hypothetical protein
MFSVSTNAATTPITYPLPLGEKERLIERDNWMAAQASIAASESLSESELKGLRDFDLIRYL